MRSNYNAAGLAAITLLLLASCETVAGHLRPAWAPSVGELTTVVSPETHNLKVAVAIDPGMGNQPVNVPGAEITVTSTGESVRRVTDNEGRADFGLPAAQYKVTISFEGFATYHRRIVVKRREVYSLRVILAQGNAEPIM